MPLDVWGKIRILHLNKGERLPAYVALAEIHREWAELHDWEGWYAVTPNGVAHGPHASASAFGLARSWIHNYRRDGAFWLKSHVSWGDIR